MGHSNLQQVLGLVGVTWQARERLLGSVGTERMLSCWGWGSWGQMGRPAPSTQCPSGFPRPPTRSSSPKAVLTRIPKAMTFSRHSREKREVKTMLNTLRAFS